MKVFFLLIFFLSQISKGLNAQNVLEEHSFDLNIISNIEKGSANIYISYYKRTGNDKKIMQQQNKSVIAKYNPISLFFKGSMLLYQNVISQQLSKNCPYEITCSNFSKQCIKKFGLVKGVFLSADRLNRCNRISLIDINPLRINTKNGTIIDEINYYCSHD